MRNTSKVFIALLIICMFFFSQNDYIRLVLAAIPFLLILYSLFKDIILLYVKETGVIETGEIIGYSFLKKSDLSFIDNFKNVVLNVKIDNGDYSQEIVNIKDTVFHQPRMGEKIKVFRRSKIISEKKTWAQITIKIIVIIGIIFISYNEIASILKMT